MTIESFTRHQLLFGPSPGAPAGAADRSTSAAPRIWAKREDCNSGIAFGGNKTRKLEYLVADALAKGCDTLVSIGGVQSNHTRQVAAVAASVGSAVRARPGELGRLAGRGLRQGRQHPDQPAHGRRRPAGEGRVRDRLQGELGTGAATRWRSAAASRTRSRPGRPTTRWAASASPTGRTRSSEQERELGVFFDTIVVCSVTGSTQAGHGRRLRRAAASRGPRRVLGIDASAKPEETREQVDRIARNTAELIGARARPARRTRRRARRALPRRRSTASRTVDPRRDAARRPDRGHDHRPGVRGQVDGRRSIDLVARARSHRTRPSSTPTWAASRR